MDASLAGGVGAVAEGILLDIVVVSDGGGTDRKWGAQLCVCVSGVGGCGWVMLQGGGGHAKISVAGLCVKKIECTLQACNINLINGSNYVHVLTVDMWTVDCGPCSDSALSSSMRLGST